MKENAKRFVQTHAQQDGLANRTYVLVDPCGNPIVTPVGENE